MYFHTVDDSVLSHQSQIKRNTGCCLDKFTEFRCHGESSDSVQHIEEGPRGGPRKEKTHVQGLVDLTPQVAGQIFLDKDNPKIARPCEEVADDVGVVEKSQQTRFHDLRSWRDCLPFVVAPPDTTTSASTELHQLLVWVLRIAWLATVALGLLARGGYGVLFLVRT